MYPNPARDLRATQVASVVTALASLLMCVTAMADTLRLANNDKFSAMAEVFERVGFEAARRAGITLRIEPRPLIRGSVEANDGLLDGELARIADIPRQFPNLVAVPVAVAWSHGALYGRPADIAGKSRADLMKLRIGTTRGNTMLEKSTAGLDVRGAANIESVLDMLRARQVDVAVLLHPSAEAVLAQQGSREFVAWPAYWVSEPLYIILNRKHAADAERLKTALTAMEKEGFIDKVFLARMKQLGIPDLRPASP